MVVNDTCGHHAGDQLLKQLASIIRPLVRDRDTLARLGGDEFAVLLEACPNAVARKIADDLLRAIQDFRFSWDNKTFNVGASIGIAHFTNALNEHGDPLGAADAACYKAKIAGRNQIQEVNISLTTEPDNSHYAEMQWVSEINEAIEKNDFTLFHQKLIPIKKDITEGLHFEVLLRMIDAEGNLIQPGAFLPAAERYNVIDKIDRWVIKNTLKWLSENPVLLPDIHLCNINISGISVSNKTLTNFVEICMAQYKIPCEKICFEITESAAIHNLASAMSFMEDMRSLGCSFSLDDFGTGMSSFSYLKQLPVNHLKIDGSFIQDIAIANDPIDLAMARSINEIGQVMGIKTVAEFVENEAVFQLLKRVGVDYAQGYHIAKPTPLNDLLNGND